MYTVIQYTVEVDGFFSMAVTMLLITFPYLYKTWGGSEKSVLYNISLELPSVFSCIPSIFASGLHFCLLCSFLFGFQNTKYMLTRVWRILRTLFFFLAWLLWPLQLQLHCFFQILRMLFSESWWSLSLSLSWLRKTAD